MTKKDREAADWRALGRLVSTGVKLFTLVRDEFSKLDIGLEILPWVVGEGERFLRFNLAALGEEFQGFMRLNTPEVSKYIPTTALTPPVRWRVISPYCIEVNLDAKPTLPFAGATPKPLRPGDQPQRGWVKLEKRPNGGLYVDDRKFILYLSERQRGGCNLRGYELREELTGAPVLHPNILDALLANPQLFPESWKRDEAGNTRLIYFWGLLFRDAGGRLCVRYCCFSVGRWVEDYRWLSRDWGGSSPAARLES